jgi:SSS family solute:Na+ symporter
VTVAVVALYLVALVLIGAASARLAQRTSADFFLAARSLGPVLLLTSLLGAHMTAFSLLGASAESYQRGIGVFALMASSSALVAPVVFLYLGTRVWALARRHGFLTQVEYFRERWGSEALATLLFAALLVLLVPYLLLGVKGGGLTLVEVSGGVLPEWLASLITVGVVLAYVALGGMRGTAWVNFFQTVIFVALGGALFAVIVGDLGGLGALFGRLAAEQPALLVRGDRVTPLEMLSYTAIPLSVAMFPHMFLTWLTARSGASFRLSIVAYPLCVAAIWLPSVLLGVMAAVDLPGLHGPAASSVLMRMLRGHAPGLLGSVLAGGVFAAVMASIDTQVLALSTMFTRDVVGRLRQRRGRPFSERAQVVAGRAFVAVVLVAAWALSLAAERSLFRIGVWAFTGFAGLLPLLLAALFWRRSTAVGGIASIVTTMATWAWFLGRGWSVPAYTVGGSGLMPVVVVLGAATLAMVVGSLASAAPSAERVERFVAAARGAAAGGRGSDEVAA